MIDLESGWKIDLMIRKARPFSRVEFERRTPAVIEGVSVPIATLEDVVISKLEWARLSESARQIEDVAALLRARGDDVDTGYVDEWVANLGVRAEWEGAGRRARGNR